MGNSRIRITTITAYWCQARGARSAQHRAGAMYQGWDKALVRHFYGVFCICRIDSQVTTKAAEGFRVLVQFDMVEFGQQFPPFAVATKDTLRAALAQAEQDPAIRQEYEKHLIPLVFGSVRPSLDEAYGVFRQQAEFLIGTFWRADMSAIFLSSTKRHIGAFFSFYHTAGGGD